MTRSFAIGAGACLALALATPTLLHGQMQEACAVRASQPGTTGYGIDAASLPVDRLSDILVLGPGVSGLDAGELSVRGAGSGANAIYVNGVPATPGVRFGQSPSFGGSYFGTTGPGIRAGTNAYQSLRLTSGLTPLDLGNVRGGAIELETAGCAPGAESRPLVLRAGLSSDAMFGSSNGLGFNRLTVDGTARFGRFEIGGAATVEGQESVRLGRQQNQSPIYLAAGVDTSLTFNDGTSDVTVDVTRFRASDGIRIPRTASSRYTVSGQLGYYLGERHRLQLTGIASQGQARGLSYENLYNPRQAFAVRSTSQLLTGSWFGRLSQSDRLTLSAEAHLSLQWDHGVDGPLSDAGERDTRKPSLGLMLSPIDFRFDGDNFAVNDELVNNFRTNTGRRSPYDLDNPDQYLPVDRYRNNAYGVLGFSESGGPVGQLAIYDEKRVVGKGVVTAQAGSRHRLRAGIEVTRYDVNYYASQLASQAFTEAYVESPSAQAAFGEYRLTLPSVTVTGGVRYDRFKSGASRADFPRISSMPGFDPDNPTALFITDKAHSQVSPRLAIQGQVNPRVRLFGGYSVLAQQPDFSALFAGINTDISVTNINHVFGTDLGYERSGLAEAGADFLVDSSTTLTSSFWSRSENDLVVGRLRSEFDPFRGSNTDIRRLENDLSGSVIGLDLQLTRTLGERGQAWLSYSFASPDDDLRKVTRQHHVAAAVMYETGRESALLGGLLRNTGVYGVFRAGSGTRYTRCPSESADDVSVLSGQICTFQIEGDFNGANLPVFKVLDLRVTRGFMLGNTELVGFVDARNLLNLESVTRVFAQTGDVVNRNERDRFRQVNLTTYANEAQTNGVLGGDGSIDLSFGGAADPRSACGTWATAQRPAPPNCVYLIGAEERFGNGDHIFTVAEQTRAIDAYYYVGRGQQNFTAPGRRLRLGIEVRF